MHGNVAEWTWDAYSQAAYTGRLTQCEGNADCPGGECGANGFCTGEVVDPVVSAVDVMPMSRVVRGGAFDSEAFDCRHAARRGASERAHNIGFRLVRGMIQ